MRAVGMIACLMALCCTTICSAQNAVVGDAILGIWKAEEKVLSIEVYKAGTEYRAKIISFTDHHSNIPSDQRTDGHNPDESKRSRKMIGMDVLTGLRYDASDGDWQDGEIYDAASGKTYSASASMNDGILSVRAYKGISLLGKTLHFHK